MPKRATTHDRLGKNRSEIANDGDHVFFHRPRAKNSDTLPPLGKILEKPPIMAITPYLDCDHAKASDDSRPAWEKLQGKPPIMATSLYSITMSPKLATTRDQLGKNSRGNRHDWRSRFIATAIVPNLATIR